jgi:hypothetical protein
MAKAGWCCKDEHIFDFRSTQVDRELLPVLLRD